MLLTTDTVPSIEEGILQTILNRGGMSSMLQYVAIICFAVGMGGMLDRLGVLGNILNAIYRTHQQRWQPDLAQAFWSVM